MRRDGFNTGFLSRTFFQHAIVYNHFIPIIVGVGKERRILIGSW